MFAAEFSGPLRMTARSPYGYHGRHSVDGINAADTHVSSSLFEEIARTAALICQVPIAAITFSDPNLRWLYSEIQISHADWMAAEAVFLPCSPIEDRGKAVADTIEDPRCSQKPFALDGIDIRFYANVPIRLVIEDRCVGILSVAACEPRQLSDVQRLALDSLARLALSSLLNSSSLASAWIEGEADSNRNSDLNFVLLADCRGRIDCANPASARYLESISLGLADINLRDLVDPEYWTSVDSALSGAIERRLSSPFIVRVAGHENTDRWMRWIYQSVADLQGRTVAIYAVGHDISEFRQAELALAKSERQRRQLFERTPALLHSMDAQGNVLSVSDLWLSTLGYSRDEVLDRSWSDFLTPASREYVRSVVLPEFFRIGHCRGVKCAMTRKDGRAVDVQLAGVVLDRRDDGTPLRSMIVVENITDHRKIEAILCENERRSRALVENLQVGFAMLETISDDASKIVDFRFVAANAAISKTSNFTPNLLIGKTVSEVVGRSGKPGWDWLGTFTSVVSTGNPIALQEVPTSSGGWVDMVAYCPGPGQCAVLLLDMTERKQMQSSLAEQHKLLRVTLHSIADGVVTTDQEGCITYLNPAAERLTGWSIENTHGLRLKDVFDARSERSGKQELDPVSKCLAENRVVNSADSIVLISRVGREHVLNTSAAPIVNAEGQVLGAVLVFHDVTEQRRLAKEMSYRATHDALTGLLNRAEFETRLERMLTDAHETGSEHAMLYIDLDQFKVVNDAFGHIVGDQMLQQVTEQLAQCIRTNDTLARLGGDEFGVILEQCDMEWANRIATRICEHLDEFRFTFSQRRFHIGASIGLVPIDNRWPTVASLLQAADSACYAAKDAGRNRVHSWVDADEVVSARHGELLWITRLEQALDEDRFELYAQLIEPLDSEDSGVRCELLLRLREPDGNLILPGVFLLPAERFQMASRIDRWVVKRVFAWMACHRGRLKHVKSISVNLSGQSIGDRSFHRYVRDLADTFDIELDKLCFEITETAAITNLRVATEFIELLRLQGISFALDDFGSGASSFGYLKALPVDYLKIDGQFVTNLDKDPIDRAMVRCISDVANALGKRTVAEFVETSAVAALLRDMGIDYIQGYFVHVPAPMDEVLAAADG
ncbi:PAS domain S-box-containing protein/diguanylate cyclase (GGDEF) domain-containing protein [Paraburkholderia aspalathi]|uniref:PAS domain S-box-containing protein/diguanylate cyclase (GGDEF) domain-containing protein n=2 Tax=Paraburkholderia aspalathi TaxID=1324617 RepID=A0A1I7ER05_9BURK|nr:PAS domain S-box-containing protein/diguanylate cyclase (GGDEF) domain-containing protein [Paraburkholderia aspalathi]